MKKSTLSEILDAPVDLKGLMDKLDFSEEAVIQANREQPGLFLEASRYRVKKMRSRIQSESNLKAEQANASMFLRLKKKSAEKGSSFTEGYIRDKVTVHPRVIEAQQVEDNAQVYEEWAKLLLEAYRQRGHAIKTLAEILGAEANAQARLARKEFEVEGFEKLKNAVRKRYPGRREE
jgi:hypothetical protein